MPGHGPNLDDPKLFSRRAGVPILDVHTRGERHVDAERLALIARNSNRRAAAGDPALVFIGHTDDDRPEQDQPPLAGYAKNYQVGEHAGRPCILADLFYRTDRPDAFEYPRRSVEVYYSDANPDHNYVDSVALLKRSPERDLGLVPYHKQKYQKRGSILERYAMADSDPASTATLGEADLPALQVFMADNDIPETSWATGIRRFLRSKSEAAASDASFDKEDLAQMQKYAKFHGIDLSKPGQYEQAMERYKKDRRAGTLFRTRAT